MKPDKVLVVALGGHQINALVLIILSGLDALQGTFVSRLALNYTWQLFSLTYRCESCPSKRLPFSFIPVLSASFQSCLAASVCPISIYWGYLINIFCTISALGAFNLSLNKFLDLSDHTKMHRGIFFLYKFLPQSMKFSRNLALFAGQRCPTAVKTNPCLAFPLIKIIFDPLLWTSDRGLCRHPDSFLSNW